MNGPEGGLPMPTEGFASSAANAISYRTDSVASRGTPSREGNTEAFKRPSEAAVEGLPTIPEFSRARSGSAIRVIGENRSRDQQRRCPRAVSVLRQRVLRLSVWFSFC